MTTETTPRVAVSGARMRFLRHYVEMVLAMVAGMLLLGPIWDAVTADSALFARTDVGVLVMATNMTLGMSIWMRYRGHGWAPIAEMGAAMYAPFAVLLVPHWLGALSEHGLMLAGHVLMLPAMLLVMLFRRAEYSAPHLGPAPLPGGPVVAALARRWPTWLGLLMTFDLWINPTVPPTPILLMLPGAYLVIGLFRRTLRDRRVLALQLAGLAGYLALALVAMSADPRTAGYLIAAGWLAHALWDLGHHIADRVVPRGYAELCIAVDLVIGLTILFLL
ncbi:hypothetical protein [Nonomuraea sp. NPDC048916]|uniref:hypothetical protein n=1 Tax=Nonomuraea sp. NPDC048916 TaxID=3154232 RepID=UPI00340AF9FC